MLIIDNPLFLLFITLGKLIFFLTLFKILNYLESKKSKNSNKASKSESKIEEKSKDLGCLESNDEFVDYKKMTNYLYDRFVTTPTSDDDYIESNISESFISEDTYAEIRNKKVEIKVEPVTSNYSDKENLYKKIEELTNNNRTEKERLLDEFNGLSREMKLLLIENILQKID